MVGGLGWFFYTVLFGIPDLGDPDFGEMPSSVSMVFGLFLVGFVLFGISAVGYSFSKRR